MKRLRQLILLVGLFSMSSLNAMAGQISHTVTYDPSKLSITYDTINGIAYAKVEYDGLNSYNQLSYPELPTDLIRLSVPYNATDFNVRYNEIRYSNIRIDANVYPSQEPRITNDTTESGFMLPDSLIYNSSSFYPFSQNENVEYGYMCGSNKYVSLLLSPVLYNPSDSILRLLTEVLITISYNVNSQFSPQVSRNEPLIKEEELNLAASCVANGNVVLNNSYQTINHPSYNMGNNIDMLPTYNYCIITNRILAPAFKKIIALKRQKGLTAGTICIEDLMSSSIFNGGDVSLDDFGDTISVITDSAGVVRQYLKYAFSSDTSPTKYVLLGGKKPFCPIRIDYSNVETDLYFSNMTYRWRINNNLNNENTTYNTQNKFFPDLFVGRLLCKNASEIDNYSQKLIRYTFGRGITDYSYINRSLFTQEEEMQDCHEADSCASVMNSTLGLNTTIIEEVSSTDPTGAQIIHDINTNKYGYISFHSHGQPYAIVVNNINNVNYRITVADCISNGASETGNGFDCLSNKCWPNVIYSIACKTMPYRYGGKFNIEYSIGQMLTLSKGFGTVAFLGNTDYGYVNTSSKMECEFLRQLKKYRNIGKAEGFSKLYANISNESVKRTHNLLGDPEFEMWTSIPQQYLGLSLDRYASSFSVNGVTPSDTIAFCDNDGNVGRIYGENGSALLSGISHNSSIMVYNHDHIPFLFPLMLQKCEINNSQYVYASSFGAGRNVVPGIVNGNVTIKNGAVYEVDATDDVLLSEGFIVENGANFNVKTPGKVIIDGCVFQSGAKVKIEAGNIEFVGKFTAERGAKVEFTEFVDE